MGVVGQSDRFTCNERTVLGRPAMSGDRMRFWLPTMMILTLSIQGCVSIQVQPVDRALQLKHVCIRENPRVKIDDFVGVVQDGFDRHGISTELVRDGSDLPERCEYVLTYAAVRAWDLAEYMHYAHLRLEHKGATVAYAEYRLINKGGLDLRKFRDVKAKMDPVIDELLGPSDR